MRRESLERALAGLGRREAPGVMRVSNRMPSLASSLRTARLSADCEIPSFAVAPVRLPSRTTARKAGKSSKLARGIHEFHS